MGGYRLARLTGTALVAVWASWVSAAPQQSPELEALIARVGQRVAEYYRRAQSVMCVEHSTVQPVQSNWTPEGFARIVESDLRIESELTDGDSLFKPTVIRDIRRINGRAPRERDKKDRAGCTDPTPWSTEPLAFLLPTHRDEYLFTSVRQGKEKDRAALIIEFMSTNRSSKPELMEDERGHDDCFDWSGPVAMRGRVWVDPISHDVVRVDRRIDGPIDVRVPWPLQRRYSFPGWIVLERDDMTLRYQTVAFSDPEETLLLPESIESLTVLRSSLQSVRRTDRFSNYRRFLTAGRVIKDP
jgi:hypothetical protein